jgi:hypothetical protein
MGASKSNGSLLGSLRANLTISRAPSQPCFPRSILVGRTGLEPVTPCASCKCATNCANGPLLDVTVSPPLSGDD